MYKLWQITLYLNISLTSLYQHYRYATLIPCGVQGSYKPAGVHLSLFAWIPALICRAWNSEGSRSCTHDYTYEYVYMYKWTKEVERNNAATQL